MTVQGGRTGITAGAVPDGGHVLNLSRMNKITGLRYDPVPDRFFLSVQPGVALSDLRRALAKQGIRYRRLATRRDRGARRFSVPKVSFFFPPDPTESTATIGGMIACNASGARTFKYGPTRKYIEGLRVALADGSTVTLATRPAESR